MPFQETVRRAFRAVSGLVSTSSQSPYGLLDGIYPSTVGSSPRGTRETLVGYSEMPWLRAVSQKIAQNVASVEWQLWAPTTGRKRRHIIQRAMGRQRTSMIAKDHQDGNLRRLENHILLDALATANDYLVGPALMRTTQIHLDLIGEAFWLKERNGVGAPVGFWPIPPHWIRAIPSPQRPFYQVSFSGWQGDIPEAEMLWMNDPNPENPYGRGSGLARALADELETDEYAARHSRAVFLNRARPDLIIWPEETKAGGGTMLKEQADRLAERWRAGHQGFWRAALPYFATRKLGVKEINQTFNDLQLTELRKFERDMIVQVFGMPPEELGILENSNRATIDAADHLFKRNLIVPRLEFIRSHLQERLVPEYDENIIIDFENPVSEDKSHILKVSEAAPWALTVNEWRGMMDQSALEGDAGMVHMVPVNMTPMSDLTVPPPGTAPPARSELPAPSQRMIESAGAPPVNELTRALDICREMGDAAGESFLMKDLLSDVPSLPPVTRRVARHEREMRLWMFGQFLSLASQTSSDAIDAVVRTRAIEVFLASLADVWGAWAQALREPMTTRLKNAFLDGAVVGAREIGLRVSRDADRIPFNVMEPAALAWAQEHTGVAVVNINHATLRGIRRAVEEALELGLDARSTARLIYQSIGLTTHQAIAVNRAAQELAAEGVSGEALAAKIRRFTEAQRRIRALVIARTELVMAGNAGQQSLWTTAVQNGQLDHEAYAKVWLAVADAENICAGLAGEDPVPINGTFSNGLEYPPAHPNCRCSTGLERVKAKSAAKPFRAALAEAASAGVAGLAQDLDMVCGERA